MEQHVYCIFIDYRGHHKKVLQLKMPLKSIYNMNFGFIEQKYIFEHYKEIETRKNLLIDFIFVMKKNSDDLFRAAPYRLMLVLHKDALFHFHNQSSIQSKSSIVKPTNGTTIGLSFTSKTISVSFQIFDAKLYFQIDFFSKPLLPITPG